MSTESTGTLDPVRLRLELEDFFYYEADLLDSRRFTEWLTLLDESIEYRMPIARNVHSSIADEEFYVDPLAVSWIDEGKLTLTQRVDQMLTGMHWAEEPVSRTSHLYTNVRVLDVTGEGQGQRVSTRLRFFVYRNRGSAEVDLLVGKRDDHLVRTADSWKVTKRTIFLDQTVLLAKNLTTFI